MDTAMVRGKVIGPPQYVKNDGDLRCHFTIGLEVEKHDVPTGGKTPLDSVRYFTVYAVTEKELTPRCQALLDRDDDVLVYGDFGFHKGKLKMRVKGIDLPDIGGLEGIPTA